MRSLVAYHVGELGLTSLGADLEALPRDPNGMIERAVSRAAQRLAQPGSEKVTDGSQS
jgi:hypothetical protein